MKRLLIVALIASPLLAAFALKWQEAQAQAVESLTATSSLELSLSGKNIDGDTIAYTTLEVFLTSVTVANPDVAGTTIAKKISVPVGTPGVKTIPLDTLRAGLVAGSYKLWARVADNQNPPKFSASSMALAVSVGGSAPVAPTGLKIVVTVTVP